MKFSRIIGALAAAAVLALGLIPDAMAQQINAQTGTTYTVANTDCGKVVTFNNAAAVAVTLPRAGLSGLFLGGCVIQAANIGAGTVTITPTTSTINGFTTLALGQFASAAIYSDATPAATGNYVALAGSNASSSLSPNNFRNVLSNGAMAVQQRGTGIATCGTTTIPSTAYSADRWGCNANVTSGAGRQAAVTTGQPVGFVGAQTLYRTSGALTQPVCSMQEIPAAQSTSLQGKTVTLSFYAEALAGLVADNGGVINAYVFTGTGADQGFGSFTASPAITPAWTGIITAGSSGPVTISASAWNRYQLQNVSIGATVTEVAVAMCFTPTATGAGVTDGFAFTGVQLEQGQFASPFEFRPYGIDFQEAQRYYVQWADGATTLSFPATCTETTSGTVSACTWILPGTMRAAPTVTVTTATSFGITKTADGTAGACSTLALIASSATVNSFGVTCALSQTAAVGTMGRIIGAATGATNLVSASADF